jgi:hypothetical protein
LTDGYNKNHKNKKFYYGFWLPIHTETRRWIIKELDIQPDGTIPNAKPVYEVVRRATGIRCRQRGYRETEEGWIAPEELC